MMKRTIFGYVIVFVLAGLLGACGAGIEVNPQPPTPPVPPVPTPPPPALELIQVPDTRGDIQWNEPDGGADSYESDDGGDTDEEITPNCSGGTCTHRVPNLDINETYNVGVKYTQNGEESEEATIIINTDLVEVSHGGYWNEKKYGKYIDKGDANDDGYMDIIVTSLGAEQVDIFLGGPNHFPGDGFEPWSTFSRGADNYGVQAKLADVDCDGVDDIIISDGRNDGDTLGRIYIYSGATFSPGAYTAASPVDYVITETDANSWFGSAVATAKFGDTGCNSIIVGAPAMHGGNGEVFVIPHGITSNLNFASGGAFSFMTGAAVTDNAGSFVFNVGDVDGNGKEDVIFNTVYNLVTDDFTLAFTHLYPALFGVLDTTAWETDHELMAAPISNTNDFYLSGGRPAGGGFINLYDDMTGVGNYAAQLVHTTDTLFSEGAAVCDLFPSIPGDELLIGTYNRIFVYYDYSLDPLMDTNPDDILDVPGYQIICEDFNGDGYPDIISGDPRGFGELGGVYVNY